MYHPQGHWSCYLPSWRIFIVSLWQTLELKADMCQMCIQYHVLVETRTPMSFSSLYWGESIGLIVRAGNRPYAESRSGNPLSPQFFTNLEIINRFICWDSSYPQLVVPGGMSWISLYVDLSPETLHGAAVSCTTSLCAMCFSWWQ